uniref:Uncharacterized protein n=1 Tax=Megaselia scalaris TaxID=36166 RepID=T1GYL7_MEGSC
MDYIFRSTVPIPEPHAVVIALTSATIMTTKGRQRKNSSSPLEGSVYYHRNRAERNEAYVKSHPGNECVLAPLEGAKPLET